MKADLESHSRETNGVKSAQAWLANDLSQELRPRLNVIVDLAKLLQTKTGSDKDVQEILTVARGLLDLIDQKSAEPHDANYAAQPKPGEQCDVLYIEDNAINFTSIKMLLQSKRALKLLQAADGEAGVALAQTHVPKLILLDLDLPDMHGSEVLQRLQTDPATACIPVVVISGDATPSQIERLLVLGARNYLTKPFEVAPFLAVVDKVLDEFDVTHSL
jgi:CheY-like chemotaxis protein